MGKYKYLVVVILFLLTGFADHVSLAQAANIQTVGFWYGLWLGAHTTLGPIAASRGER